MLNRRKPRLRLLPLGFVLGCLGLSLVAMKADASPAELRIAVGDIPKSFFPVGNYTVEATYLRGFVGRSLTTYNKSWAVACALCTDIPTLQNGEARIVERSGGTKGIDVTFHLDPKLEWDDGTPVTTDDVIFSLEVAHKLERGSSRLSNVLNAVPIDAHSFTLQTSGIRFDYNRFEDFVLLPAHIEKPIFEAAQSAEAYRSQSTYSTNPSALGLYYGPYRVAHATADTVELARNPHWHGNRVNFDRITLKHFTDAASVAEYLRSGQVDMISGELGLSANDAYEFEKEDKKSKYEFLFETKLEYIHIDLNFSNQILKDKRVRKALLLSLDREKLYNGDGSIKNWRAPASFLPPTSPNFDPILKNIPYDLTTAEKLLEDAGFLPGRDGIRVDHAGRRLSFHLAAQLDWQTTTQILEAIKGQWRKAGIEIILENAAMAQILPRRQFDMAYYFWGNTPEFLLEPIYSRSGIPTPENGYTGLNFPGLDNNEMNGITVALATEMDPSKRLLLWRRAQRIYAEELPALPLSFTIRVYVLPPWLSGVEPTGHMIPTSYWAEDWRAQ
jgi:peptide/nickel transport system substrate-binding protein